MKNSSLTPIALLLATSVLATAETIPYTNNFDGTGSNVAFATENTDPRWSVGSGVYTNSITGGGAVSQSAVNQFSDMENTSFSISSQFEITSVGTPSSGSSNVTIGFSLFGRESAVSNFFLADLSIYGSGAGDVRLVGVGSAGDALSSTTASTGLGALATDTVYTLKLDVENTAAGNYSLTFGLYDAAGTTLQGSAATANITGVLADPSGGYYTGFRNRTNISSGTNTVEFDNFSVTAIPEPGTFALLAGALSLGAVMVRRRRA